MSHTITFYKYQGAGNDFVLIDNRNLAFDAKDEVLIERLCDRRFGIGGDGLMLLQGTKNFDFEMLYFNADGREGTMCGNGGRCLVAFARDLGIIKQQTAFLAVDGRHDAEIHDNEVNLGMIPVSSIQRDGEAFVLNTGSPHYVQFVQDLQQLDVYQAGYAIRNNERYAQAGINVNFIEQEGLGYFVRTFERGVEDETYACGTGAVASAMSVAIKEELFGNVEIPIRVLGGQLQVSFNREGNSFTEVYLKGPALRVFEGTIDIS